MAAEIASQSIGRRWGRAISTVVLIGGMSVACASGSAPEASTPLGSEPGSSPGSATGPTSSIPVEVAATPTPSNVGDFDYDDGSSNVGDFDYDDGSSNVGDFDYDDNHHASAANAAGR